MSKLGDDIANKVKIFVVEGKGVYGGCSLSALLTGGIFGIVCAVIGAVLLNLDSLYTIYSSSRSFVMIVLVLSVLCVIITLHYLLLFYKEWNIWRKHILEDRRTIIEKSLDCIFVNTSEDEKRIPTMNLVIKREQVESSENETNVAKCGTAHFISTCSTGSMPMSANMI